MKSKVVLNKLFLFLLLSGGVFLAFSLGYSDPPRPVEYLGKERPTTGSDQKQRELKPVTDPAIIAELEKAPTPRRFDFSKIKWDEAPNQPDTRLTLSERWDKLHYLIKIGVLAIVSIPVMYFGIRLLWKLLLTIFSGIKKAFHKLANLSPKIILVAIAILVTLRLLFPARRGRWGGGSILVGVNLLHVIGIVIVGGIIYYLIISKHK